LADELKNTIIPDIASIHLLSVTHVNDHGQGPILLAIQLKSFGDCAQLFFAEGHLLIGSTISIIAICPLVSGNQPGYNVESVAGRRGDDFVVTLDGPATFVEPSNMMKMEDIWQLTLGVS
jgi:hypothetical protein